MPYTKIDGFFLLSTSAICESVAGEDDGGGKMTKHEKQTAENKQSIGHFVLQRKLARLSGTE